MNTKVPASYSVYPGEFVPVTDEEEIRKDLKHSQDDNIRTYVDIKERINIYEVQISAPGVEREEFIVYGDDNLLLICTDKNKSHGNKGSNFQRHIAMPADADTELAVAECKHGILYCYIPKAKQLRKHASARIVVY